MATQLEKLKQKSKEIAQQIKELEKKELLQKSKNILRKQQVIGKAFWNKYKDQMDELKEIIDPLVKKIKDRKLFGLNTNTKKND